MQRVAPMQCIMKTEGPISTCAPVDMETVYVNISQGSSLEVRMVAQ